MWIYVSVGIVKGYFLVLVLSGIEFSLTYESGIFFKEMVKLYISDSFTCVAAVVSR